jgi:hypothetical protein
MSKNSVQWAICNLQFTKNDADNYGFEPFPNLAGIIYYLEELVLFALPFRVWAMKVK